MQPTIDPRAIAIGAVVDNVVTLVVVFLVSDWPLSVMALAGLLSTAIGGCIAARIAGVAPLRHGAGVGVVALGIGVLSLVGPAAELPGWYTVSAFALIVPAGMLGGLMARLRSRRRADQETASARFGLALSLVVALSAGCATRYVPTEWTLRDGVIPAIDVAGAVTFTNAQPSTTSVSVYSYLGTGFEGNYHEITEAMVKQAAGELKKNGRPRAGKAKTIALKVTYLQSRYIAFFWKSTIQFTAALGNGQTVSKEVPHASGNVVQDLNGCIAEGVIYLLNDETVRAYLASA